MLNMLNAAKEPVVKKTAIGGANERANGAMPRERSLRRKGPIWLLIILFNTAPHQKIMTGCLGVSKSLEPFPLEGRSNVIVGLNMGLGASSSPISDRFPLWIWASHLCQLFNTRTPKGRPLNLYLGT